jgi:L-ascorbate metabolism protein UlaG (beta-lactamase superfamily)
MKNILLILLILVAVYFLFIKNNGSKNINDVNNNTSEAVEPTIAPVEHASFVLNWGGEAIFNDPVGGVVKYSGFPLPTIIFISDIHGDHFDIPTLEGVVGKDTSIVAPEAVILKLTDKLKQQAVQINNGEKKDIKGYSVEAIPMYNLPEATDAFHTRGRGNGYVVERGGFRVYIAGDTEDVPEMRALTDVDMAFIPMNLPYTMEVGKAAEAVLEFRPKKAVPYHYRGPDGLSDVNKFKQLVNTGDPSIEVLLLDWYPVN